MLVGEQPADQEDRAGLPFVGPAGRILDDALDDARLPRAQLYVTNAVKHFKWKPRGKRRIHQRPNRSEVLACHQWLERELAAVEPAAVVALGAVAGQSLLGPSFRVRAARRLDLHLADGRPVIATLHPSAVLRAGADRDRMYRDLVDDLVLARDRAGIDATGRG